MSVTAHPVGPEEIMAHLDGELLADQAQSVSAHIESCTECRELAASLRSTSQLLSDWTTPKSPSVEFDGTLAEAARSASSAHRPAYKLRLVPFAAAGRFPGRREQGSRLRASKRSDQLTGLFCS